MSGIRVCDVKFLRNQLKNYFKVKKIQKQSESSIVYLIQSGIVG